MVKLFCKSTSRKRKQWLQKDRFLKIKHTAKWSLAQKYIACAHASCIFKLSSPLMCECLMFSVLLWKWKYFMLFLSLFIDLMMTERIMVMSWGSRFNPPEENPFVTGDIRFSAKKRGYWRVIQACVINPPDAQEFYLPFQTHSCAQVLQSVFLTFKRNILNFSPTWNAMFLYACFV